jgi:hypothetical protein
VTTRPCLLWLPAARTNAIIVTLWTMASQSMDLREIARLRELGTGMRLLKGTEYHCGLYFAVLYNRSRR